MNHYTTILFDLDHTLWDYEKNSEETLSELHQEYEIYGYAGITPEAFISTFNKVNQVLWTDYNRGVIDRETIKQTRFKNILRSFEVIHDELSLSLSKDYIAKCQQKTHLIPYALELLDFLKKKYRLYLLTNGFDDVQTNKINNSRISHYFEGMVTSETCGHRKPSKEIFNYTLEVMGETSDRTLMVGDNLNADVLGAQNANIDAVFFNPKSIRHKATPKLEIACLSELMKVL